MLIYADDMDALYRNVSPLRSLHSGGVANSKNKFQISIKNGISLQITHLKIIYIQHVTFY